ncbi:pyridoxamine 5'-phosphate oxidase family protein [Panacibacter ginsenosidivorans]|uniref:Pyridoxamine 5'-phosphate oxidase family protein n=1 Tax=Panacibacter ginsenosidivorans TaxID=1813871 RepID=A0A5B8V2Z6_9BACT|nr:pyridoxamine 5'-phosphate oxidase family protein [Panacibacter ginsenosidivorans]QEC65790.1 pyridoxamine 5'-phosphate oxidase family protein [Panacibacter ginsenosidivorans]
MIDKLNDQEIEEVLKENILGRIGCNDGLKTYVVPVNYVYDGKFIIAHSVEGMKIKMMRKNPDVCFEVDEMKSFTKWKSVIVWGQYQELTDKRDRYYAMKLFVDRMMHMKISATAILPETEGNIAHPQMQEKIRPVVYRIVITEKTGRFEDE